MGSVVVLFSTGPVDCIVPVSAVQLIQSSTHIELHFFLLNTTVFIIKHTLRVLASVHDY